MESLRLTRAKDQSRRNNALYYGCLGAAQTAHGSGQQHDAAIGGEVSAVEVSDDFLRPRAGNRNGAVVSSDMAGVVRHDCVDRFASIPNP